MSGPQLPLKILPKAATDIKQILKYTQQVWGNEQRIKYKAAIDRCLKDIGGFCTTPQKGIVHIKTIKTHCERNSYSAIAEYREYSASEKYS